MRSLTRTLFLVLTVAVAAVACSGGSDTEAIVAPDAESTTANDDQVRLVSPAEGAALVDAPPDDLVILDVRTPEEFAEGHIDGALLVDFYDEDFRDQLAVLDPTVPYLVYCRSGNRSGQAVDLMKDLGFTSITDVDGGIIAWTDEGYEVTR